MIEYLAALFESVSRFIVNFYNTMRNFLIGLMDYLTQLFHSLWQWVVDQIFTFAAFCINLVTFDASLFDTTLSWGGVPDQAIYVLNQCGIGHCLAMLVAAIGIRVTLNLIPSWATRV